MPTLSEVVSGHIAKHWKDKECQLCGGSSWAMNGPFGLVPVGVDEQGYVAGYRTAEMGSPVIAMVCYTCGHTSLIDYNIMIGMDP